ncbi:hypothetical protein ACFV2U_20420 [Streptomyces sp. NPDC059697]|uniref:hypothetical protein n=1 Tax=Streptomyces sp. NPDC059697 TaxID=3346912 RepID=UPI00369FBD92
MSEQRDGAGEPRIPRSRLSDYAELGGRPAAPEHATSSRERPRAVLDGPEVAARRREFAAPLGEFRRTPALVPLGAPPPTSTTPVPGPTHTGCPLSAGREEQPLHRRATGCSAGEHGHLLRHRFEVEPVAVIPASSPRAADELDEKWRQYASASALYGDKGEFLTLPPLSGGSEIGWAAVTDPVGEHLPSRIAAVTGSPEFLAVSMDGHHLCAASAEEDDYWVVQHELS